MAGLSETNRGQLRDRIAARIDKAIDRLKAEVPTLAGRVEREARAVATKSLGLDKLLLRKEQIEEEEKKLTAETQLIERTLVALVRGVPVKSVEHFYRTADEVDAAILTRQRVHEDKLLGQHPIGKKIIELKEEKDNLLDTVMLATSNTQVKEIWQHVDDLLGETPTKLQKAALRMTPVANV